MEEDRERKRRTKEDDRKRMSEVEEIGSWKKDKK